MTAMHSGQQKITDVEVRMYRMGTGDCFVVKFFAQKEERFTMMFDCGTWQGTGEKLADYIADLKGYVGSKVDVLVVTHEHKDHVYAFEACRALFDGFAIGEIWMAWTENDGAKKVKQWKKEFGDKKKAVAQAADHLAKALDSDAYKRQFESEQRGLGMLEANRSFVGVLNDFKDLHLSVKDGAYVGSLEGMRIVKEELAKDNVRYFEPGDTVENLPALPGVTFYVLGPPLLWEDIKLESAGGDETYSHNKELAKNDALAAAIANLSAPDAGVNPFDDGYEADPEAALRARYEKEGNEWRRIDQDWLYGAGGLALRINSVTNNLSLALAIEFEGSKKVLLFPGDAEYGSWASWHTINWGKQPEGSAKHFTEDLLNRTVFYKVAHHLSHNGTAKNKGLEMMTHKDLAAMATLDYNVISKGWKSTMPNRELIKALLTKTKGKLMIMNTDDLYYDAGNKIPLQSKIHEAKKKMSASETEAFRDAFHEDRLYLQFRFEV